MSELNARQWRLYNHLKESGDTWEKQRDIARSMPELYPITEGQPFHDSGARLLMTKDIQAINKSDIIQKIIISSSQGVKLANKEEARRFIAGRCASVLASLERVRKLERKAGLDGQLRLVFGREREIIQAFAEPSGSLLLCDKRVNL
jgi:hypothetical protein